MTNQIKIWPSYLMVFVIFNLLGLWYRNKIFFSWWWAFLVAFIEIIFAIILAIVSYYVEKSSENIKRGN